jgi:hypothetical protein
MRQAFSNRLRVEYFHQLCQLRCTHAVVAQNLDGIGHLPGQMPTSSSMLLGAIQPLRHQMGMIGKIGQHINLLQCADGLAVLRLTTTRWMLN